nr:hypothetical protein CFP56_23869 [Quercus suber]
MSPKGGLSAACSNLLTYRTFVISQLDVEARSSLFLLISHMNHPETLDPAIPLRFGCFRSVPKHRAVLIALLNDSFVRGPGGHQDVPSERREVYCIVHDGFHCHRQVRSRGEKIWTPRGNQHLMNILNATVKHDTRYLRSNVTQVDAVMGFMILRSNGLTCTSVVHTLPYEYEVEVTSPVGLHSLTRVRVRAQLPDLR